MPFYKLITNLSASSRMIILNLPSGTVTFVCANILILFLTVSIPLRAGGSGMQGIKLARGLYRSSEAFSSSTALSKWSFNNARAKHRTDVVFPVPGGPWSIYESMVANDKYNGYHRILTARIKCGMLPSSAMPFRRPTVSGFPTTSSISAQPTQLRCKTCSNILLGATIPRGRYFSTKGIPLAIRAPRLLGIRGKTLKGARDM